MLGFNTVIMQLVVFREIFSFMYGNELIFGVALTLWFLFTGAGALLARYVKKMLKFSILPWGISIPLLAAASMIWLFLYFKNAVFMNGVALTPLEILLTLSLILLPICLLSGFVFSAINAVFSSGKEQMLHLYAIESLGSIFGGLLFSFVLVRFFNLFQIVSFLSLCSGLVFVGMLVLKSNRFSLVFAILLLVGFSGIIQYTSVQNIGVQQYFAGQNIVEIRDNEYGKMVLTESAGQYNLYDNGMLTNTTDNEMANEEAVHYAMVQSAAPNKVLVISGNMASLGKEIHKYAVQQLDYVEINPDMSRMQQKYFSKSKASQWNVYQSDARVFLRNNASLYDVVLLQTAEPTFAQSNRFYTVEFFSQLKMHMTASAVVELSLAGVENYMNPSATQLNSSVFNSLKSVFKNVVVIPGNKLFLLASDGPLTRNIAAAIAKKNIQNLYVNTYYLDDALLKQQSDKICNKLQADAPLNHDLKPITYFYGLKYWLSQYQLNLFVPFIIICLGIVLFLLLLKPVNLSLFSAGFTASAVEMILVVAYQALYGYVYAQIGFIFTLFMAGLFLGSFVVSKRIAKTIRNLYRVQLSVVVFLALLWGVFQVVQVVTPIIHLVFYVMILLQAILTGLQFAIATQLKTEAIVKNAGNSYGIELFGSAAGALMITVMVIPLLGISTTLLGVMAFNIIALLVMRVHQKLFSRFA